MPAPHAFYSKMLAERTASRNVFVLFYFIYFIIMMNYLALLENEDRRVTYRRRRRAERDALLARRLSRHIHVL
jgi:hypothetical protein